MKLLKSSTNLKVLFISCFSLAIFAKAMIDKQSYSTAFMSDSEIKFEKVFEEDMSDRIIASYEKNQKAKVQYLPINAENLKKVNGSWEITRILDINEDEIYNKVNSSKALKVNLTLISTSLVRINDDESLLFDVSFITSQNTIVIFRSYLDGYEIIEAKKVFTKEVTIEEVAQSTKEVKEIVSTEEKESEDYSLVFERGLIPSTSKDISKGENTDGIIEVRDGAIENLEATLFLGSESELTIMCDPTRILDGGIFDTFCNGERVGGIVTKNGKDAIRIRFNSGKLEGAMLNFTSDNEKLNIIEKDRSSVEKEEERKERAREEALARQVEKEEKQLEIDAYQAQSLQEEASESREEAAGIDAEEFYQDGEENVDAKISNEQAARIIASEGFSF